MNEYVKLHESEYGKGANFHITRHGDQIDIELTYPPYTDEDNTDLQVRYVYVNQESVRASDGIRMFYDFQRDGWVIQQGSVWEWAAEDTEMDEDWQEVAFIQSWAREPENGDDG